MKDITKEGPNALSDIVLDNSGLHRQSQEPDFFEILEKLYQFTKEQEHCLKVDLHSEREIAQAVFSLGGRR